MARPAPHSAPRPGRRPTTPVRRLVIAAGALAAGLPALLVVATAGRVSVAGFALIGIGLLVGTSALLDWRRQRDR